jgi:hypothetical protein
MQQHYQRLSFQRQPQADYLMVPSTATSTSAATAASFDLPLQIANRSYSYSPSNHQNYFNSPRALSDSGIWQTTQSPIAHTNAFVPLPSENYPFHAGPTQLLSPSLVVAPRPASCPLGPRQVPSTRSPRRLSSKMPPKRSNSDAAETPPGQKGPKTDYFSPEDFSNSVKKKLEKSSRTGQACDRCKVNNPMRVKRCANDFS